MTVRRKEQWQENEGQQTSRIGQQEGLTGSIGQQDGHTQDLVKQIDTIRSDIANLAKTLKSVAGEQTEQTQEKLLAATRRLTRESQRIADDLKVSGQEAVDYGTEKLMEGYGQLEETVRKHPTTALMIALGLGYVVGLMSRRR